MRVTWARIILAVTLIAGVTAGLGFAATGTGHAAVTASAAMLHHHRAMLTTPSVEICDVDDLAGLCANTDQGNLKLGNPVIAYTSNDPNDDYQFIYDANACAGSGKITLGCPYMGNGQINQNWHGSVLVQLAGGIDHTGPGFCLSINSVLQPCDLPDGSAQYDGQEFAVLGCTQLFQCEGPHWLLNIYWTRHNQGKSCTTQYCMSFLKIPTFLRSRLVLGYYYQPPQHVSELFG